VNARSPAVALDRPQIVTAVATATRAPSILNSQPWRFAAGADAIEVFAVPDRAPTFVDPTGREVMMSVGAALLNLRLALIAAGRSPRLHLMPDPDDQTHAATVTVGGPEQLSEFERPLYEAIPARRSSRLPFTSVLVRDEEFLHLQDAAVTEGAWLDAVTGVHRKLVLDILHEADRDQRGQARVVAEMRRWTVDRTNPDLGIPVESLGPLPYNSRAVVRDMALGQAAPRASAEFEVGALLAVLLTTGDHPIDWLRAGMAMQRVLLAAETMGLSAGVLSHGTEAADLRPLVRDPSSRWRYAQIILRFGHGEPMPATPRLPVDDVLELG
jgi:nitroreductase